MPPEISVVIPALNEEESLPHLYAALTKVLAGLQRSCEILFVDDGSSDGSFALLRGLAQEDPRVTVVRLRRPAGKTGALAAGFDRARGDIVITLDADLQDDPEDIPALLSRLDQGCDVVSGWRRRRQDRFLDRRLPSLLANRLIGLVTGVHLHDYGCGIKAYRREVLKEVRLYGEMHRFLPALCHAVGGRVAEIEVRHHRRRFGRSKYGLSRTVRVVLDLITVWFLAGYATRPLHAFGGLGLLSVAAGAIAGVAALVVGGTCQPLLWLALLLIMGGGQLIGLGLLGEMITRTYYEGQRRPVYYLREVVRRDESG